MADAYWRYSDGRQQQAAAAAAAAAALPPLVAKRPRTEYDIPSGHGLPSHYGHDNEMGVHRVIRDVDPTGAYERYLLSAQISSYGGAEPARSVSGGISGYSIEDPRVRVIGGSDPVPAKSRTVAVGGDRPEVSLPPDASNTLFVEGLPSNCKRREVSHIFRPFVGYKEVRLVTKESRHRGGEPLVLCFVDFVSPAHAATAKDALQGIHLPFTNRMCNKVLIGHYLKMKTIEFLSPHAVAYCSQVATCQWLYLTSVTGRESAISG